MDEAENRGNTFITESKGEKLLTGVMPLEGSEENTQEATEIKVVNSNEQQEHRTSTIQEGNLVDNVFNSKIGPSTANPEISQIYGDNTTGQSSYYDSRMVSRQQPGSRQGRAVTRSPMSRYRNIPTKNVKFEKFIELIFKSRMQPDDIKDEIIKYVQALETSYTDAIRDLKTIIDREKRNQRKIVADKVN